MKGKFLGRLAVLVAASAALLLGVSGVATAAPKAAPNAVGATLTSATVSLNLLEDTSVDTQLTTQVLDANGRVVATSTVFFTGLGGNVVIPLRVKPNVKFETLVGGTVRFAFGGDGTLAFGYKLALGFSDGDFSRTAEDSVVLDPAHPVHVHPLQFAV